jgi:hypothetical protein
MPVISLVALWRFDADISPLARGAEILFRLATVASSAKFRYGRQSLVGVHRSASGDIF